MQRSALLLLLLIVCCLALTGFVLREDALRGRDGAKSALAVLFGDGRRLFANHFLAKADAYFHRGRYPSIFEMAERERGNTLIDTVGGDVQIPPHNHGPDDHAHHDDDHAHHDDDHAHHDDDHAHHDDDHAHHDDDHAHHDDDHAHHDDDHAHHDDDHAHHDDDHAHHDDDHEHGHGLTHDDSGHGVDAGQEPDDDCAHAEPVTAPSDWIARLAQRFEPDRHVHLERGGEKEMLPWVRLAVEMDPHNVDAYTVGGYWLREVGKPKDAEVFLREGQRNNPDSSEIYFELGRLHELEGGRLASAARLYQLSLEKWKVANEDVEEPDLIALGQILGRLGKVEEQRGELRAALYYYQLLQNFSPRPEAIQRLIDSVRGRLAETSAPAQPM